MKYLEILKPVGPSSTRLRQNRLFFEKQESLGGQGVENDARRVFPRIQSTKAVGLSKDSDPRDTVELGNIVSLLSTSVVPKSFRVHKQAIVRKALAILNLLQVRWGLG